MAEITGDKPANGLSPDFLSGAQEYQNHSRAVEKSDGGGEKVGADPLLFLSDRNNRDVSLRSKPVQITSVTDKKSGRVVFHVAGTLRPRAPQSHTNCQTWEDALEKQREWEEIRVRQGAASRPKMTALSYEELRQAEAAIALSKSAGCSLLDAIRASLEIGPEKLKDAKKAIQLAEGEPFSLVDAVKYSINQRLRTTCLIEMPWEEGLDRVLAERGQRFSPAHRLRVRQRVRSFFLVTGKKTIKEITAADALAWVESRVKRDEKGDVKSMATWNKLVTDPGTIFGHFIKKGWCSSNPFAEIERFSKMCMGAKQRLRLEVDDCRELMAFVEANHPAWCCYFVLTLFLGIRPDLRNGEIYELSRCIERDGAKPYYSNAVIHLTKEITKEREPREVQVPVNVRAWLEKYPLNKQSVCPGDYKDPALREIRAKFKVPHDGLRHTAVSAFMAAGNNYDQAADQFGNSEKIIRDHYLKRMSPEEAQLFFAIKPKP